MLRISHGVMKRFSSQFRYQDDFVDELGLVAFEVKRGESYKFDPTFLL
jgi:hypothetical protein